MRLLAEILDEKNKDWDEQVQREIGEHHDKNVPYSQEGEIAGSNR